MTIRDQLAQALLETEADAIVLANRDGIICFWNPGATRVFGYSAEEAVGRSLDLIIPENLRARHWHGWMQVMATGKTKYGSGDLLSVPAIRNDGRRVSIDFTITILRSPDKAIAGVVALLRDVSSRFDELRALRRRVAAIETPAQGDAPSSQ